VLVYIHGFNQSFEQATLDAARLADGVKFRGETILFTWPSRSALLDYIHDRDSAMWSRDALESMLLELIGHPAVNNIHIVAHSMGTMLSVEALRQVHSRLGETAALKMGAIVLASPDIDIDVFASTVRRIGSLSKRITVLTAANDRALGIIMVPSLTLWASVRLRFSRKMRFLLLPTSRSNPTLPLSTLVTARSAGEYRAEKKTGGLLLCSTVLRAARKS
jgi:esterase/lipase superfamily enzyme